MEERKRDEKVRKEIYNFNAGPAILPTEIIKKVKGELLDYKNGYSIMEMSHRSNEFKEIMLEIDNNIRNIMNVPKEYEILWMHGGANMQFSSIPLNFCGGDMETCHYLITGNWSRQAYLEAVKCLSDECNNIVKYSEVYNEDINTIELKVDNSCKYIYYCDNETINGVELGENMNYLLSKHKNINWIVDMSSNLFTRPFDITKYSMVYACAQKNFGIAGSTLVIIKKNMLKYSPTNIPSLLNYNIISKSNSLYNTPCVFSIYISSLMLNWIKLQGGIPFMYQNSLLKSNIIFSLIDNSSGFYYHTSPSLYRSRLNLVFRISPLKNNSPSSLAESLFLCLSHHFGFIGLEGHRSIAGIRVSLYNSLSISSVIKLHNFMKIFYIMFKHKF